MNTSVYTIYILYVQDVLSVRMKWDIIINVQDMKFNGREKNSNKRKGIIVFLRYKRKEAMRGKLPEEKLPVGNEKRHKHLYFWLKRNTNNLIAKIYYF